MRILILILAIKGKLSTPCLEFDTCTDANTMCSSNICVCSEESYDKEGLCGKTIGALSLASADSF